jgi:hypothetical protein
MVAYDSAQTYDSVGIFDGIAHTQENRPYIDVRLYDEIGGISSTSVRQFVRRITITRGRGPLSFGTFDPSRCEIDFIDFDSSLFPANTAGLTPRVNTPVSVTATWGGEAYPLFHGFLDECQTEWHKGANMSYATMSFTDGQKLLAKATTTIDGFDGDLPANRILSYLADINLGSSPGSTPVTYDSPTLYNSTQVYGGEYVTRLVDTLTTSRIAADDTRRRSVLEAIRRIELAEAGALYFDTRGRFVFLGRGMAWPTGPAQFDFTDDETDTHGVSYTSIKAVTDEQLLYNRVTVTRADPTAAEQLAENTTSQAAYFTRDLNLTGVIVNDDVQAKELAQFHLAKRALPLDRVEQIEVAAYASEPNLAAALNLNLLDIIGVRRAAPNWTAQLTLAVSGIRHQITPDDWRVTVTTQNDLRGPVVFTIDTSLIDGPDELT